MIPELFEELIKKPLKYHRKDYTTDQLIELSTIIFTEMNSRVKQNRKNKKGDIQDETRAGE